MTLAIENCHTPVHTKKVNMSKLEYARSFGVGWKTEMGKFLVLMALYAVFGFDRYSFRFFGF